LTANVTSRAQDLVAVSAPLGVARQHPEEVAGPDRGLVAADALTDLDDHVLRVVRVVLDERDLQLVLELSHLLLESLHHLAQVAVGPRVVEVGPQLPPLLRQLVRRLELLQLPARVGRGPVVGEDGGVRHPLLRLRVGALQLHDEVLERHGKIVALGGRCDPRAGQGPPLQV
jgi:hypothetical protein